MGAATRRGFFTGAAVLGGAALIGAPDSGTGVAIAYTQDACPPEFGPVTVRSGDVRYVDLSSGANQRFIGKPDYIQVIGTTEQVVAAVDRALRDGKRIAVRSGGHCYENFVSDPEVQAVIDVSQMSSVYYDHQHRAFAVEAGASLLDVYESLFKRWGVTVPGGSCPTVGAGGHIIGGGYGPLARLHGLTVDHLHGVEVVTVGRDGRAKVTVATRDSRGKKQDLWWAHTGGGGGNFGIVTRYLLRSPEARGNEPSDLLPRPPSEVLVSSIVWPWSELTQEAFGRLVRNFGGWHERNSDPGSPYAGLFSQLKLLNRAAGVVAMATQIDATADNAQQLLEDFIAEVNDGVGVAYQGAPPRRLPWHHALHWQGFNPSDPTVMRFKIKSAHMRGNFPDDQVAAVYRNLTRSDYPNSNALLLISSYGGRINSVAPDATAVAARDSVMKLQYVSLWAAPDEDDRNIAWVREFYSDVYSATGGVPVSGEVTDGCYIGYPDVDLGDPDWNRSDSPWHELYYAHNYSRLQKVKAHWDPGNVFRHAQSVRLP
ncbi:FAD-binding protein [Thermobifida halotolerans]|uniref:FAD-binding protein n=1 Tax=Thermobifida halotolerans TaxID=483545 RepID=A0A399G1I4_9ACTN|nr:FAD-binding protein [Thermobifida halotolerans]UOE18653.1 FAD-binding protein [Thermobifida halotolerans]